MGINNFIAPSIVDLKNSLHEKNFPHTLHTIILNNITKQTTCLPNTPNKSEDFYPSKAILSQLLMVGAPKSQPIYFLYHLPRENIDRNITIVERVSPYLETPDVDDLCYFRPFSTIFQYFLRHKIYSTENGIPPLGPYNFNFTLLCFEKWIFHLNLLCKGNRNIIICNLELEEVLGIKVLSLGQLSTILAEHLTHLSRMTTICSTPLVPRMCYSRSIYSNVNAPTILDCINYRIRNTRINPSEIKMSEQYCFSKQLIDILTPISTFNAYETTHTFSDIVKHLVIYITGNYLSLFDSRNMNVCICQGTELGKLFELDAFHLEDLFNLIVLQIKDIDAK